MHELPLSKVYQILEPGPTVLLTTEQHGRANVMALSWHMMVEFDPPLVACVVSNADFSFTALKETRECVIAVPSVEIAAKVVQVGNCSGRDIDKFLTTGLRAGEASQVRAPLVMDCFANFECKVVDTRLVAKYCLFVLEVMKAWTDPTQRNPHTIHHQGHGTFMVSGDRIKLPSKMP